MNPNYACGIQELWRKKNYERKGLRGLISAYSGFSKKLKFIQEVIFNST